MTTLLLLLLLGRFDQLIHVPPPDQASRRQILELYISRLTTRGPIDLDQLALHTNGFTGADLFNLCQRAGQLALKIAGTAYESVDAIESVHLWAAVNNTTPSAPKQVVDRYQQWARAATSSRQLQS